MPGKQTEERAHIKYFYGSTENTMQETRKEVRTQTYLIMRQPK